MRIVFAGTPETAVPTLDALYESAEHELVAVITQPDATRGRGRKLARSAVAERALELGLPLLQPHSAADPEFLDALRALEPDCCPIVAYGQLLTQEALDIPTHGWINLHFSLLPQWRGAAPVQWAIRTGDTVTGATTFILEEGMDTGPIVGAVTESISAEDTTATLMKRLSESGANLVLESLDALSTGTARPQPQAHNEATYTRKITTDDARISWNLPAHIVSRQIRSVTPAPGAWCLLDDKRLKIGKIAEVLNPPTVTPEAVAGQLVFQGGQLFVKTADKFLEVCEIQAPGKRMMNAADWARGARLTGEEIFQ